jgi:hypothetical protein
VATPPAGGFAALDERANVATAGLLATVAVAVLAIAFDLWEISLLGRVIDGDDVSLDSLQASDTRQGVAGALELGVLILSAVTFIRWFAPAYRNLPSLGAPNLRFTPGWAIGAWFVPVLNLWRPKQIANDIWRGSDPEAPAELSATLQQRPVAGIVTAWWVVWLVSSGVGRFGRGAWFDNGSVESLRSVAVFDAVGLVIEIVAALLTIAVVRRVTAMQSARSAHLRAAA